MRVKSRRALYGLVAVFLMSAVTAGVASAAGLPEFKLLPTKNKFTSSSGSVKWKIAALRG
jgi:hypothetical protein